MKIFAVNKKAEFDYEILERFEAGIALTGHEAKSIKMGHINLSGSHVIVKGKNASVIGMSVSSFQPINRPEKYDSERVRKLLLNEKELGYLAGKLREGLTLLPIKLYNKKSFMKLELGLGRGKKKWDKREALKKRETEREIRREI
ncbi:MAG: SsrA-binding protein [Candidatus Jorgensenbacteria bacterium GW2011_GWA2_45_9]|uniref:SsrA-binding protein n=1 Tax=Candidatus Jorgensenbacteria bacterium GW2011_GWA2_45_9 TaxID=1618663 RepID=A0A0G1N2R6_9BACT|nr:MAG: SsrA-binding protein [Candidatus Jorgensenbacteria bacterium GW2011_GWA2_45_9]